MDLDKTTSSQYLLTSTYEANHFPFPQPSEAYYKSSNVAYQHDFPLPNLSVPPPQIPNPPHIINVPAPPLTGLAAPMCPATYGCTPYSIPKPYPFPDTNTQSYSTYVPNANYSFTPSVYSNAPPPVYSNAPPYTTPLNYPCNNPITPLPVVENTTDTSSQNRSRPYESSSTSSRYNWSDKRQNRSVSPHRRELYSNHRERYASPDRDYRRNGRSSSYHKTESFSSNSYGSKESSSRYGKHKRSRSPEERSKSSKYNDAYSRRRSVDRSPKRRSYSRASPPRKSLSRTSSSISSRSPSRSLYRRSPRSSPLPFRSGSRSSPAQKDSSRKSDRASPPSPSRKKTHLRLPKKELPQSHSFFSNGDTNNNSGIKSEGEGGSKIQYEEAKASWVRSAPADLYYTRDESNPLIMKSTPKLVVLCSSFEQTLIKSAQMLREKSNAEIKKESSTWKENEPSLLNEGVDKDVVAHEDVVPAMPSREIAHPSNEEDVSLCNGKEGADCKEKRRDLKCHRNGQKSKCSAHRSKGHNRRKKSDGGRKKSRKERNGCATSNGRESGTGASSTSSSSCSSSSSSSENEDEWAAKGAEEMERKRNHPNRLDPELWFNDPGEMNDGPLCRCSIKARRSGIRHGYYAGEDPLPPCLPLTNNADRLYHYLVTISPPTNFLVKTPSTITHDSHEFIFEGFSLLSHHPLEEVPTCQVIRFNIEYSIFYVKDKIPENFCIRELDLFYEYLFKEILELVDLNFKAIGDNEGCPRFHFMPRFVRQLPDNGKEVLSMNEVLRYLMRCRSPLVLKEDLAKLIDFSEHEWLNYTDQVKGMIVTCPGKKPCSIRVDQLDRDQSNEDTIRFPIIVHFGIRPPQLSYAGNPEYQRALREYVKFRHLLANMPKPSFEDKRQLEIKENRLQEMRMGSKMKRDVTVAISADGFNRTGIMCDIVQHALLIPVLVRHLRFHQSLSTLEKRINYKFKTRFLLQLSLTHPSYRENFGTNPDHARNSLTNCGVRQPQYGDRRIHFMTTHKRGINTLVNIMSRFGKNEESESKITHNERLEFLGDAVVEFLTSIHLFHLFPTLEEGGLATYRAAVVQNQHLSVLADKLSLDQFVLHAHGSDLCHTVELRHAMANCFEALMGAIFLDSHIEAADAVFSDTLFTEESELHDIWVNYKPHPLQEQEPQGDRRWLETFPILQKLTKFEESIGVEFTHIRLLARAFMDRSVGFNYLTLGSNQRLEFLGDTVLQLVTSEHLYRFFPEHHEGHLSLLRSSLVNNRTQAVVCDDLQLTQYAMYSNLKTELKTKDRADLLEAFLGALYIDRGLDYCRVFSLVCFFPRLQQFIINQEWNDPKSKLQQCCLTLRTMEGGEPDIPVYKVIECKGPTNTRVYTVAVYFKNKRLAKASGHSIQQAEMNAAKEALLTNKKLFPQLAYQRRVIEKNIKIQGVDPPREHTFKRPGSGDGSGCARKDRDTKKDSSSKSPSRRRRSPDRTEESGDRRLPPRAKEDKGGKRKYASSFSEGGREARRERGRDRRGYRREGESRDDLRRSPSRREYRGYIRSGRSGDRRGERKPSVPPQEGERCCGVREKERVPPPSLSPVSVKGKGDATLAVSSGS